MPTTPSNSKKPAKKASKSKQLLITLKISSTAFLTLARRLELPIEAKSDSVSFTGSPSPPSSESAKLKTSSQDQSPSESASTPAPTEALSVEGCLQEGGSSPSKTGSPSLKPSLKRSSTADIDKDTKNKGKPGPKKKQKLEDGSANENTSAPVQRLPKATGGSKLGPKASLGAINAGLRALDRSGTPCKRWNRKGLQLKSFTGITWELPAWRAPKSLPKPTSTDNTTTSSVISEGKEPKPDSNTLSDRSNVDENSSNPPASSPSRPPIPA